MESHRTTPKDFFLYLFAAGTLYTSATTLITLLWQLINRWLPDTAMYGGYDGVSETIRWSVALLVVIFPAYLVSMWWIGKEVDREPGKREMWVRRWFIWATLFIAAVVALGDLAAILYSFLGGELALRFFMKAFAVGIVAKAVFWYHWYLLRREPGTGIQTRKMILGAAIVFVGAAIVTALVMAGSPASARAKRNDLTRVNDLQNMQYEVTNFWQLKQRLPKDPAELIDPANPIVLAVDPKTGEAYRYEARGKYEFALCANFEADYSAKDAAGNFGYTSDVGISSGGKIPTWEHGPGETCFTRTIDPERYRYPEGPSMVR